MDIIGCVKSLLQILKPTIITLESSSNLMIPYMFYCQALVPFVKHKVFFFLETDQVMKSM